MQGVSTQPWIEVWPLKGKRIDINRARVAPALNVTLAEHIEKLWAPKSEKGWKSSWVPFVTGINFFKIEEGRDKAQIDLGTMAYKEIEGINDSIEKGLDFALKQKYNPCLSVGFLTATRDSKVIFQRRPENVHCPNILIHEPCGYMTSLAFATRAECDKPEHVSDARLFNLKSQLDYRRNEIAGTFGVAPESVSYEPSQDLLACGWKSIEMYFSTTGKIDANQGDLKLPEKQEVFFVPFEHLKPLIHAQGRLSKIDPTGYRPTDPREIPLIDESLIGLIYGYERLTGDKLDISETIDRLNREGLEIKVHDTSPGKTYDFPTSF